VRGDAVARRRSAGPLLGAVLITAGLVARAVATGDGSVASGQWLTDEQGRQYVVRTIPRAAAVRIDARTVRTKWSVPLDVVREDEASYYYKFYRTPDATPAPPPARTPGPAHSAAAPVPAGAHLDFLPFGAGLPAAGQWRDGFALADMNGDGLLDVVHGPARKGRPEPVVFLGDGAGSWRRWEEARFPPLPYDYGAAAAGDLNGDGVPDLALAVHLRGLLALRGDGHGGFADASRGLDFAANGGAARFSSRALAIADVNGDGRLDIVALGDGPRPSRGADDAPPATGVVVFLNDGRDAWRREPAPAVLGHFGSSVATADLDGDGRPDVAAASGAIGRRDLVSFAAPDGRWRPSELPLPAGARVRAITAGDVDGDGRADLVLAWAAYADGAWRAGIDLVVRNGDRWDARTLAAVDGLDGPSALAVGDVTGDRRADVVALTTTGETWVLAGTADGFVREAGPPAFGPGCGGSHVELADLDGDGRAEIVAAFARETSPDDGATCPSRGGLTAWKAVARVS
jgi:hypothetical protein